MDNPHELAPPKFSLLDAPAAKGTDLRLTEDVLRGRILFEQSKDGVVFLDENMRVVECNQTFADMLGYPLEEMPGLHVWDFDAQWTREELFAVRESLLRGRTTFETRHRRRDGTIYDVEIGASEASTAGRKLVSCICRDISARKQAAEALRESEERYRLITEMVTSYAYRATFTRDHAITFQWVVGDFVGITSYQPEELVSDGWFRLIHPDDLPFAQRLADRLRKGETVSEEMRIVTRGGAVRWIRATVRPFVPASRDEPLVTYGAVLDITERKATEESLRLHSQILEHLAEGVFLARSQDGTIVYANPSFERIFGYDPGELLGKHVEVLNAPGDPSPAEVARRIIAAVAATGTWSGTVRNVRRDGSTFSCWAHVTTFEHPLHGPVWVTVQEDITERIENEAELQRQRAELELIFDTVPAFIFYKDRQRRLIRVNQELSRVLGLPREAIEGRTIDEIGSPYAAQRRRDDEQVLVTGQPKRGIIEPLATPTGTRWLQTEKLPYRDADGRLIGIIGISLDITERKAAEDALRESEEFYRRSLEMLPNGVLINRDDQVVYCNQETARLAGLATPQELCGRSPFSLIHPQYHAVVRQRIERLVQHNEAVPLLEEAVLRADGTTVPVAVAAIPIQYQGRRSILVVMHDLTELKRVEIELERQREELQFIFDTVPALIFYKDRQHRLIRVNEPLVRLAGFPRETLEGHTDAEVGSPYAEAYCRDEEEILATGKPKQGLIEQLYTTRGMRWIQTDKFPYRDRSGELAGVVGFSIDITERKAAEEKLAGQHAELLHVSRLSAMGQMVVAISHEVAQPLAAISNFAAASLNLMPESPSAACGSDESLPGSAAEEPPPLFQYVAEIRRQSQRAGEILQRLRDFTRKSPANRARCDLNVVVRDSVELTASELRRRQVAVQMDLSAPLPAVLADRIQLQQVIVNLLTNAADAMADVAPSSRLIRLVSRADERHVTIEVADRGAGIPADAIERVFEPFYTTKPNGMGIGLGICRTIVRDHGGEIEILANPEGGAVVRLRLPCSADVPGGAP